MSSLDTTTSHLSSGSTMNIVENEVVEEEDNLPQNASTDDKVFQDKSLAWGWRSFKPSWLQWLNSPNWFVFFLCWFTFLQGMAVNSFVNLALPTLEKRFKLNSKLTGFIISSNDITALILVMFVSFFGSYGHKTKWLGYGSVVTGIAALTFTIPKFLVGKYRPADLRSAGSSLCFLNATSLQAKECNGDSSSASLYYMFFILSQLLAGAGTTSLFTLGPAYIDENVHPKKMSWYLGVFYLSFFLGPSIGSILGGQLLSIHVDLFLREGFNLTPTDPRWIGNWWLGSFVCGFILVLLGCILLGFPSILPGSVEMRKKAIKKGYIKEDKEELTGSLKKILPSIKSLFTNWTYLFQALGSTFSTLIGLGVGPFFYKLLTGKYGASLTEAGIGIAIILLPGSAAGIFIGSFVTKKVGVRDSCKRAAKVTFLLQLVGVWGSLNFLIPGCDYDKYAGVDVGYRNSSIGKLSLEDQCSSRCHCSTSRFRPVCAPNGINYYSPCFAGCTQHIPGKVR
ncbi:solute carrier organic anion transporter family member 4C1-like [Actinia tenebrosa]|uniref:Solute carrier organic anion transporter family member n=1 Tax=Actinia tenebrosa TaxID=6105 RepID=A0A6P8HNA7_ACTTE|nr:solute carrier organic anion transporter family member 4C1-like [Actinia tenebrosa]